MSQANVSRAKAIRALKNNNNDIVNAIMVRVCSLMAPGLYKYTQLFNEEPNIDFRSSEFHEANVFRLRIERFIGFLWRTLSQRYLNLFLCSLAGIDDVVESGRVGAEERLLI